MQNTYIYFLYSAHNMNTNICTYVHNMYDYSPCILCMYEYIENLQYGMPK